LDQTIPGIHCGEFLTTHTNTATRSQNITVLPKTLEKANGIKHFLMRENNN